MNNIKKHTTKQFKYKKHMSIGAMSAEEDSHFLQECFIDTGDFEILTEIHSSKCIVLGRTGSGKSALLETIKQKEEHVIELLPEELSLGYISNSNILSFFENIGVNLDLFYQLLWRHVLSVELIKKKFKITNEYNNRNFLERLGEIFNRDRKKEKAIEYLRQWGDKFWLETDSRIKELTTKLEDELRGNVDLTALGVPINASGSEKLTKEIREEICERAQAVVNRVQIQDLNQVIGLLAQDIFNDTQQKYFITIDKLDDNWVEDEMRYRLIRALIETTKTFRKISQVKIIIALRLDLLGRVFDKTRDAGFQEEKYEDILLRIKWSKEQIESLLDKRISLLIRQAYTQESAKFHDIFPAHVGNETALDFILDRTLMRPRDAILYINECLEQAQGQTQITAKTIRDAEITYSKKRLNSICHEWFADYPLLENYFEIIKKRKDGFKHSEITREQIEELAIELAVNEKHPKDPMAIAAKLYIQDSAISRSSFLNQLLRALYKTGVIGVKKDSHSSTIWSQDNEPTISESEVKRSSFFHIHPMLWRVLGIHNDDRKKSSPR